MIKSLKAKALQDKAITDALQEALQLEDISDPELTKKLSRKTLYCTIQKNHSIILPEKDDHVPNKLRTMVSWARQQSLE